MHDYRLRGYYCTISVWRCSRFGIFFGQLNSPTRGHIIRERVYAFCQNFFLGKCLQHPDFGVQKSFGGVLHQDGCLEDPPLPLEVSKQSLVRRSLAHTVKKFPPLSVPHRCRRASRVPHPGAGQAFTRSRRSCGGSTSGRCSTRPSSWSRNAQPLPWIRQCSLHANRPVLRRMRLRIST